MVSFYYFSSKTIVKSKTLGISGETPGENPNRIYWHDTIRKRKLQGENPDKKHSRFRLCFRDRWYGCLSFDCSRVKVFICLCLMK